MTRKRHKPEEIVAKLRQVDVLVSRGQSVADAIRTIAADVRMRLPAVRPLWSERQQTPSLGNDLLNNNGRVSVSGHVIVPAITM